MKNARKFQLMRGEISTLIIAGVLVVAGVGVLMSSALNQNKQTTNTKAAEGCAIESISADLSGGICKFTINYTPTATNLSPRDLVCALINPKRDPNISFNQLVAEQRAQLPAGWDVFSGTKNGRIPLFAYSQYNDHLNPTPDGGNYRLVVYDWRKIQSDPTCVKTVDIPSGTVTSTFGGGGGGTENPTNTPVPGGAQQPTPTAAYNVYLPFVAGGNTPTPTSQPVTAANAYFTCEGKANGQCFGPQTTGGGYIACDNGVASGRENCGKGGPAIPFCTRVGPGDHCDGTNIVNCKGVGANPTGVKPCGTKGCAGSTCNGDPTPTFTATPTSTPQIADVDCMSISGQLWPDDATSPKKITLRLDRTNNKKSGEVVMGIYGDGRNNASLFKGSFPNVGGQPDSIIILPTDTKTKADSDRVKIPDSGEKKIVFEAGIRTPGTTNYLCKKAYLTCKFSIAERWCKPGGSPSDATGSTPPTPTPNLRPNYNPQDGGNQNASYSGSGQSGTTFTTTQESNLPACSQTIRTGCYQSL